VHFSHETRRLAYGVYFFIEYFALECYGVFLFAQLENILRCAYKNFVRGELESDLMLGKLFDTAYLVIF
jgi:hypothetical protein